MNRFLLTLIILLISAAALIHSVLAQEDSGQANRGNGRHRHRHGQHSNNNEGLSIVSGSEGDSNNFVAAYRPTETPAQPEEVDEEENDNDEQYRSRGSLESRLANLEQDVRHLCLEDEEDLDRQIRALGVKCVCPKTEAPVCGSDNVTYYNRCFLHCRAQQAEMSYHRYKITLKKFGRC